MNESKKERLVLYFYAVLGLLCLTVFIMHVAGFVFPEWYYNKYPDTEKYVGVNIVSPWADFSYFTYHSLIIFSVFSILLWYSHVTKNKKLKEYLIRPSVVGFVVTNYVITFTFNLFFDLFMGGFNNAIYSATLEDTARGYHGLGVDLFVHYFVPIVAFLLIFLVKSSKNDVKHRRGVYCYLTIYFIIVAILGRFAYVIEWYPYPFFDFTGILEFLGLNGQSVVLQIFTAIIVMVLLWVVYGLVYKFLRIIFKARSNKKSVIRLEN